MSGIIWPFSRPVEKYPVVKKDMTIPGNLMTGIPVLLMNPQIQLFEELLHDMVRDILHGQHQFL